MIIAELIQQLSMMDLTLTVYVETDHEIAPVHSIDTAAFNEGELGLVSSVLLIATEENREDRPAGVPDVEPGDQGNDHPPEQ
jgi:hypothetical protein